MPKTSPLVESGWLFEQEQAEPKPEIKNTSPETPTVEIKIPKRHPHQEQINRKRKWDRGAPSNEN
jgi:hypothetical protein